LTVNVEATTFCGFQEGYSNLSQSNKV